MIKILADYLKENVTKIIDNSLMKIGENKAELVFLVESSVVVAGVVVDDDIEVVGGGVTVVSVVVSGVVDDEVDTVVVVVVVVDVVELDVKSRPS